MTEIKISVSNEMNKLLQNIVDKLGIKKTEFVKSLVIEQLREIKLKNGKKKLF